jgi:hypothetical protein
MSESLASFFLFAFPTLSVLVILAASPLTFDALALVCTFSLVNHTSEPTTPRLGSHFPVLSAIAARLRLDTLAPSSRTPIHPQLAGGFKPRLSLTFTPLTAVTTTYFSAWPERNTMRSFCFQVTEPSRAQHCSPLSLDCSFLTRIITAAMR